MVSGLLRVLVVVLVRDGLYFGFFSEDGREGSAVAVGATLGLVSPLRLRERRRL